MMGDAMEFHSEGNSLLKAVYLGRLRLTRLLLEGGAYINESNENGETPLMVACKTRHMDHQSTDKARMVRYLLESGADPNIQDKLGRTALMHACLEQAGAEVVSLLLESGANPSLDDHSGHSALVHAVHADEKDTLRVLLEACRARGKEVIIITTDRLPSGKQMTKQYLNPPLPLELEGIPTSPTPCASPSEIELHTSPRPATQPPGKHTFTFHGSSMTTSQPGSPDHKPSPIHGGVAKLLNLQRLHSEPWLKIPSSLLAEPNKPSPLTNDLPDITPEEELAFKIGRRYLRGPVAHQYNTDSKNLPGTGGTLEHIIQKGKGRKWGGLSRNMSYDNISFARSHQDLHNNIATISGPMDKDHINLPSLATSSLRSIIQRQTVGVDHYGSDSQLARYNSSSPDDGKKHPEKKPIACRSNTLSGSRELLDSTGPPPRHPALLEHRGSGAFLTGHLIPTRPGCLPPLNPHTEMSSAGVKSATGLKSLIPSAPGFPRDLKAKKLLLRRHSIQTEQIKQLGNFEEIFSH